MSKPINGSELEEETSYERTINNFSKVAFLQA